MSKKNLTIRINYTIISKKFNYFVKVWLVPNKGGGGREKVIGRTEVRLLEPDKENKFSHKRSLFTIEDIDNTSDIILELNAVSLPKKDEEKGKAHFLGKNKLILSDVFRESDNREEWVTPSKLFEFARCNPSADDIDLEDSKEASDFGCQNNQKVSIVGKSSISLKLSNENAEQLNETQKTVAQQPTQINDLTEKISELEKKVENMEENCCSNDFNDWGAPLDASYAPPVLHDVMGGRRRYKKKTKRKYKKKRRYKKKRTKKKKKKYRKKITKKKSLRK